MRGLMACTCVSLLLLVFSPSPCFLSLSLCASIRWRNIARTHSTITSAHIYFSSLSHQANAHYSSLQPWRKESPLSHTNRAYVYSHEALRITGILLSPYLPKLMPELLAALGTSPERQTWESAGWEGPTVDAASLAKGHRAGMRARERRVLFARIVEDA